jgi:DNA-binding NtrC family response regulator
VASRNVAGASGRRRQQTRFSLKELADRAAAEAERQAIRLALLATRGNKSKAARLLRVDYKTLHLKMKRYAIAAADFRAS